MKSLKDIQTIAIVGAGTMGAGIAQVCVQAGYKTILWDAYPESLTRAKTGLQKSFGQLVEKGKITAQQAEQWFGGIHFATSFDALKADIIVEAIVEKLEVKRDLFHKLEEINDNDSILATNTSSIPVTQIARGLKHPERVAGLHFFNPAQIMKLVEVISGAETSAEVCNTLMELSKKLGKVPVMAKDSPGFIVNRVARHYYVEALKILEEQAAELETIDALCESAGFKMGPFRLMDLIGVDTNFSVTSSMYEQFFYDPKFRPSRIQKQKVDAGHHGRKTGKGFYTYEQK